MEINDPAQIRKHPMTAVIYGGQCCGFLFVRGPAGIESFDADGENSLGIYTDEHAALAAILNPKSAGAS